MTRPDEDTLALYYGAADTCIGVAHASLGRLLAWLEREPPDEREP
jgi:predicted GH43/DUF377 family glycosyl hydrolase